MLNPLEADDPTIESLGKTDRRLAIRCASCGRFRYLNSTRYNQAQTVSSISKILKCGTCGSTDVTAVAVSRDSENGYWPAEHS